MESKDLLRPENDENQNPEVNPGASSEGQENTMPADSVLNDPTSETEESGQIANPPEEEIHSPEAGPQEIPAEPERTEDITSEEIRPEEITPENIEPEITPAPVDTEEIVTEIKLEAAEENRGREQSVSEMMADIDNSEDPLQGEEEEEEKESEEETIEKMEADYAHLNLEEAVDILMTVVAEPNYNKIKQRVGILRSKILQQIKTYKQEQLAAYLLEGGNQDEFVPEVSEWERKFNEALHIFKENKARFIEEQEAEKQRNLEAKKEIIEGLKELIENESNLKTLNDKFKEYQEKWKEIGPVPQNESTNLWQNYHFYVEKFFDILRINKELRYLDLKKNLEQKIKLCETAESLLLRDSVNNSFRALQQLHDEWREIGPVPDDKKEEIWERFKNASDQINARRKEYYDKLYEEQQNNYNAKIVLCEQAEELTSGEVQSVKEYNEISDQLTELLKVWKTLGPAPSKLNDEIWNRFKSTLDKFFQAKKEYFHQMKEVQMQNYNLKLNIAILAEAIADRTDWKQATDELLNLQKEWKEIGATPRKYSEAVWKRFRAACDRFFEAKSNYFSNIHQIEAENLEKKEDLIARIKGYEFGEDKAENLEIMKAFQREWTELGHVPKKDKDRIYSEYREAVNQRFADLKMNVEDLRKNNFKNRIDTILNNPDADRLLDKERRFLTNKLNQLKDDIILWENNLGFFAHSKNADILKAEFVKKIESAKEQVKDLEYKIRMMKAEQRKEASGQTQPEENPARENNTETKQKDNSEE